MSHVFLIYISRAKHQIPEEEIKELARISAENNRKRDITGLLLYVGNYFIQVLEGEDSAVASLLTKISHDLRHTDVRTIYKSYRVDRLFPHWNMGYFNLERHYTLNRLETANLKQHVTQAFEGGETSAASLIQVIRSLPAMLESCTAAAA